MNIAYEIIGEFIQAVGVAIVLIAQAIFVWKARKKYGSLGTAFLEIIAPVQLYDEEDFRKTAKNKQKLKEQFEMFPHPKLLYDDFKHTFIGLVITLVGLIIAMFEGSITIPQIQL